MEESSYQGGGLSSAVPRAEEAIERARAELSRFDENLRVWVRANPMAAVAGATALGFIAGRIASRL